MLEVGKSPVDQWPTESEWNISKFPEERRKNLLQLSSFRSISLAFAASMSIQSALRKQYDPDVTGYPFWQAVFTVQVPPSVGDALFNGPYGLRAAYWISPADGDRANCDLIEAARPSLTQYVRDLHNGDFSPTFADQSLSTPSAKVWPNERSLDGGGSASQVTTGLLDVVRWERNENCNGSKGPNWRWSPEDGRFEIKGALIDRYNALLVPPGKVRRSEEIHLFGFS